MCKPVGVLLRNGSDRMEGEGEDDSRIAETDMSELCRGVGGLDTPARLPYLQLVTQGLLLQEICVCS